MTIKIPNEISPFFHLLSRPARIGDNRFAISFLHSIKRKEFLSLVKSAELLSAGFVMISSHIAPIYLG